MKSFMIMPLVKPIDLMTEISLTCSYKLPVIDEDREKKQMNIVIAMITLKINSSVCSAYTEKDKSVYHPKNKDSWMSDKSSKDFLRHFALSLGEALELDFYFVIIESVSV